MKALLNNIHEFNCAMQAPEPEQIDQQEIDGLLLLINNNLQQLEATEDRTFYMCCQKFIDILQ